MIKKKQFKDKCDGCNNMKVCKGFNGLVLCDDCIEKESAKPPELVGDKNEQARFDFKIR